MKINQGQYIEKYRRIRRGKEDQILFEGIHAWKHAYRFGAKFQEIILANPEDIEKMPANVLKDDEKKYLLENALIVDEEFFNKLIPYETRSKVLAIASKPKYDFNQIQNNKPIIFLENPTNPENIGMVLRVVAAFGAGALVVTGRNNPFSASVLRAGAGLIYALPVFHLKDFKIIEDIKNIFKDRKILVADAEGRDLKSEKIPAKSLIVFGTEREGVSDEFKEIADEIISLRMEPNVSSLNLATSVSAFLYGAEFS